MPVKEAMLKAKPYAVLNCNAPLEDDKPIFADPICNDGAEANPAGNNTLPLNVPPVRAKSNEACPVKAPINVVEVMFAAPLMFCPPIAIGPDIVPPVKSKLPLAFPVNVPIKVVAVKVPTPVMF